MSTYSILLTAHSLLRWLVLLSCVWALFCMWRGLFSHAQWSSKDRQSGLIFTTTLNIQLLIGIALYFISPFMIAIRSDFGAAMKDGALRFFAVEHVAGMLLAVIIAQVGYSISKRAPSDHSKFLRGTVTYTIAAVLILASIPWPFMEYGRPLLRQFSHQRVPNAPFHSLGTPAFLACSNFCQLHADNLAAAKSDETALTGGHQSRVRT